jgi:hypothetical protein
VSAEVNGNANAKRLAQRVARLAPYVPALAIATAAMLLAWAFAYATTLRTPFGLPLDDSYIYLTYAKQFGRAEPFTYFSGGGYSAGSTSVLWPMLLAPFWTLGARGHALVWVSFWLCAVLYALTLVGVYRLVRELFASHVAGICAAAMTLGIAPFAWTSLAGMEVAFASALLVWTLFLLVRAPTDGRPSKKLVAALAAASLSRPEAMLIVFFVVAVAVVQRGRRRDLRAAAWWAAPAIVPIVWLVANKLFAGNFMPNTGVAKSHFYLPGFDWTYWWDAVTQQTGRMFRAVFWEKTSPLVWPKAIAVLWLVGAVRVALWAKREQKWLAGFLLITAPFGLILSVIASSGQWSFQNYRYIAPAFPLLFVVVGCAFAPLVRFVRLPKLVHHAWLGAAAVGVALFSNAARAGMREDIMLFAQNATDLNRQVVTLGRYINKKLPNASIMFHDAGAVAYYGDTRVFDMLGLVTNHQTNVANNGPGARFEFLESLPPERRPTHFTYYPAWMGQGELFGEVILETPLGRQFHKRRLVGDSNMQLIAARWYNVHTAERPLASPDRWRVVDRIDIADVASERAHGWRGAMGRRKFGDPTAKWTMFHKETHPQLGLLLDGGRTIRGRSEAFTVEIDPAKPMKLVMRSGGRREYPWHDALVQPVAIEILDDAGTVIGRGDLPAPTGALVEIVIDTKPTRAIRVRASAPYRVFHWFVMQPE